MSQGLLGLRLRVRLAAACRRLLEACREQVQSFKLGCRRFCEQKPRDPRIFQIRNSKSLSELVTASCASRASRAMATLLRDRDLHNPTEGDWSPNRRKSSPNLHEALSLLGCVAGVLGSRALSRSWDGGGRGLRTYMLAETRKEGRRSFHSRTLI